MYNFLAINTASSVILVLIFIFISFFCLYLFFENHKLKENIQKLETENKKLLEKKVITQKTNDTIPITKISPTDKKQPTNNHPKKIELTSKYATKTPKEKKVANPNNSKVYQKNILHNQPNITSPITINKKEEQAFNLNEFIKSNELKIEKQDPTSHKNVDYLQDIATKIADELENKNIELTNYEKLQEENAIISYKELLTIKDKITILDDENETIDFIEELKKLRSNLNE